ncbi:MAG TPA: FAD-dependent oxidoreductase, partial [Flavobacteriales bacterium]|nr:FAD-dependent oxidoreductase [Flavobacteriales bacterium]
MKPLDVIVVGGGIAGMAYAAKLMESAGDRPLRIRVLSKAPVAGSSSYAAQGGVAAAMGAEDSFALHAAETIMVGEGRNDRDMVELVVHEGPSVIQWLLGMGARFDRNLEGHLELAREGGHSVARVVHHLDRTGGEIVRALRECLLHARAVELIEGQRAVDLVVEEGPNGRACAGVRAIDLANGDMMEHRSDVVVLATGGVGQAYNHTTNPAEATGDGIAMAVRAGAALRDMAFVQFHPTALRTGGQGQVPLISEAVRGAGARLLRHDGRLLMSGIHPAGDLAPRNVVARAIHAEMQRA